MAALTALAGAVLAAVLWAGGMFGETGWAMSALVASLALAGVVARVWSGTAGLLVAALFVGGGAQLWLTDPAHFTRLAPNIRDPRDLVAGGLLLLELAIALLVLIRSVKPRQVGAGLRRFGIGAAVLVIMLTWAFAATPLDLLPQGHFPAFAKRFVIACFVLGVHLACVVALIVQPPPRGPQSIPVWPLAVLVLVVGGGLSLWAFQGLPRVEDELAYLFQAKLFAHGALTAPAPPIDELHKMEYYLLEIRDGRWLATTTPGWPAGLAIGVVLGFPWLLNTVLAALAVVITFVLVRQLTDRKTALVAAALTATSPWLLITAGSLMPHSLAHVLSLSCWWMLILPTKTRMRALILAFGAGLAMGWVFTIRQLDGLMLGTFTGIAMLVYVRRDWGMGRIVTYSLGCLITGSLYFLYSYAMTGDILTAPLTRYLAEIWPPNANAFGLGPDRGPPGGWGLLDGGAGHDGFQAVMNVLQNMFALNLELLGWGIGSLILLAAALVLAPKGRLTTFLWIVVAFDIGVHAFYWFAGSFYIGPRYWFGIALPLLLLSAMGYRALEDRLVAAGAARRSVQGALVLLLAFSVLVFVPWRGATKIRDFGRPTTEIRNTTVPDNALVFFSGDFDPGMALYLNDPFLRDNHPIYLRSTNPETNAAVAKSFPDRPVVHIEVTP